MSTDIEKGAIVAPDTAEAVDVRELLMREEIEQHRLAYRDHIDRLLARLRRALEQAPPSSFRRSELKRLMDYGLELRTRLSRPHFGPLNDPAAGGSLIDWERWEAGA